MNKKKIIIFGITVGAIIIAAVLTLSLMQSRSRIAPNYKSLSNSVLDSKWQRENLTKNIGPKTIEEPSVSETLTTGSVESLPESEKKIIKNGDLTLKVSNTDKAVAEITRIAKANGGDIFYSNLYEGEDNIKSGTVTIKVPIVNFEKSFEEIKKIASLVVQESISGQDVTEQYTDLQSQFRNKQAEEKAFAKILEKSGQIDEVLKVTKELARVRGEIEVLQGRIRLLESQTDMATINVYISEDAKITITDRWRPLQVARDALNNLLRDIQKFVNFVIVFVVRIIPVLVIYLVFIGIFYLIVRKVYRKIKNRKSSSN